MKGEVPKAKWLESRYNQLCMLEEKRLSAIYHTQGYQIRAMRAFNKMVRPRELRTRDMVLKEIRNPMRDPREKGKFNPNWLGTFLIKEMFFGGGVRLVDLDGNLFAEPTNMD